VIRRARKPAVALPDVGCLEALPAAARLDSPVSPAEFPEAQSASRAPFVIITRAFPGSRSDNGAAAAMFLISHQQCVAAGLAGPGITA
jgi:hypothetical protein